MTRTRRRSWGALQLLAVVAGAIGGFVLWAMISFGPRDIPADAVACPRGDWPALNADGVEFGSIYNSTDRAERNSSNGVLVRQGYPDPRCLQIFNDKTCNLVGPTLVQVNRPEGPIVVALEDGQTARLRNNPRRPFVCGLLEPAPAIP